MKSNFHVIDHNKAIGEKVPKWHNKKLFEINFYPHGLKRDYKLIISGSQYNGTKIISKIARK